MIKWIGGQVGRWAGGQVGKWAGGQVGRETVLKHLLMTWQWENSHFSSTLVGRKLWHLVEEFEVPVVNVSFL